jgi:hypothetical protein
MLECPILFKIKAIHLEKEGNLDPDLAADIDVVF